MEEQVRKKRKVKVVPKKKSRKKLWIILGSILSVFLIAAGTVYYFLAVKEYDIADSEVEEIVREPYRIELPDGSVIEIDEEGNVIEGGDEDSSDTASADTTNSNASSDSNGNNTNSESGNGTADSGSQQGSTGGTTGTDTETGGSTGSNGSSGSGSTSGGSGGGSGSTGGSGGGTSEGGKVTVAQITSKYEPTFSALEGQADAKLDALIGRAKAEYVAKNESDEGVNYAYFFNKYSSAARELESNTDSAFYAVLGAVKNELQKNGLSPGYTETFVSEYEARKAERRNSIMSQIR